MPSEPHSSFDVAVLGGGPAGAVTAQQLALRGRRVVLVEGTTRMPSVGDHLPREGQALLDQIGAWPSFQATQPLSSEGIRSYWGDTESAEPDLLRDGEAGWHVDRDEFDAMLRRLATEAGVHAVPGDAVSIVGRPGDWQLRLAGDDTSAPLGVRYLVDATGRSCWLARRLGHKPVVLDVLYGFVQPWRNAPRAPHALVEARRDGWWYSVALPGKTGVAMFMTDVAPRVGRQWDLWWHDSITSQRFSDGLPMGQVRARRAASQWVIPPPGAGWLPVGDAALTRDPLSSLGLMAALTTAPTCAAAIDATLAHDDVPLDAYLDTLRQQANEYVTTRARTFGRKGRFRDAPFWRRRRDALPSSQRARLASGQR